MESNSVLQIIKNNPCQSFLFYFNVFIGTYVQLTPWKTYRGIITGYEFNAGRLEYQARIHYTGESHNYSFSRVTVDDIIDPIERSRNRPIVFHETSEYETFVPDANDNSYHVFECPKCELYTAELPAHRCKIVDPFETALAREQNRPIKFHETSEYGDFLADVGDRTYHVFGCPICERYTANLAMHLSKHGQNFYKIFGLVPAVQKRRWDREDSDESPRSKRPR